MDSDSKNPDITVLSLSGRTDRHRTDCFWKIETKSGHRTESRQTKSGQTDTEQRILTESGHRTDTRQNFPENPDKNRTKTGPRQCRPLNSDTVYFLFAKTNYDFGKIMKKNAVAPSLGCDKFIDFFSERYFFVKPTSDLESPYSKTVFWLFKSRKIFNFRFEYKTSDIRLLIKIFEWVSIGFLRRLSEGLVQKYVLKDTYKSF